MRKTIIYIIFSILLLGFVSAWSPISYWQFENNGQDQISNNHLVKSATAWYNSTNKIVGNYSSFYNNGYFKNNSVGAGNLSKVRTIQFWMYIPQDLGTDKMYMDIGGTYNSNQIWIMNDGSHNFDVSLRVLDVYKWRLNGAGRFPTGTLEMVTIVFGDGGQAELWYNTTFKFNDTETDTMPEWNNIYIGQAPTGALGVSSMNIDNLAFFDYRFSAKNISDSYNSGAGTDFGLVPEPPPVTTGIINVTLDFPYDASNNESINQNFSYIVVNTLNDLDNCSLMHNGTGIFTYNLTNSTPTNNSLNHFFDVEFDIIGDYLWNVECCGSDVCNSSSANRTLYIKPQLFIENIYLTSPIPDQEIPQGSIGNTTDVKPTWNLTSNRIATCFLSSDNSSWTICSTTDSVGSICTQPTPLEYALDIQYFKCNTSLTNIIYNASLVRIFSIPNVTNQQPLNNTPYPEESPFEFNATVIDYTNTTLSCNLSVGGNTYTNVSMINNTVVVFDIALTNGWYNWNITCSNNWYEGTTGLMNFTLGDVNLYLNLDSSNFSRKYELGTTANITVESIIGSGTICFDILDGTNRYINYSCGSNMTYTIDKLVNLGSYSNVTNITNETLIEIDNRTDLVELLINVTGYANGTYPEDILIDIGNDSSIEAVIPGIIVGDNYEVYKFIYNNIYYTSFNLTFDTKGEKIIYINKTMAGNNRSGNLNFTITAYDLDAGNEYNRIENFSTNIHFNTTAIGWNYSMVTGAYDLFLTNATFNKWNWTNVGIRSESGSPTHYDYGINSTTDMYCTDSYAFNGERNCLKSIVQTVAGSDGTRDIFPNIDFRHISSFDLNFYYTLSTSKGGGAFMDFGFYGEGGGFVKFIEAKALGDATGYFMNISAYKNEENQWTMNLKRIPSSGGDAYSYSITKSIADLNNSIKLLWHLSANGPAASTLEIHKFNVSGLWLNMSANGSYSNNSINWTATDSLTGLFTAPNNIQRAKIISYHQEPLIPEMPSRTNVTIYLSNDNGTTWEEVVNDTYHSFESTGKVLNLRYELETDNNLVSPTVSKYELMIVPASGSDIKIDVGNNKAYDMNVSYGVTSANTPIYYNGTDVDIVDYSCGVNQTCLIPIKLIVNQSQMIEISGMNYTKDPNPLNFTNLSSEEMENNISILVHITKGILNLRESLEFYGSKNITVLAYDNDDPSIDANKTIQVRYSHFNLSFPSGQEYWQIFPTKRNQSGIQPYGQNSTDGIWKVTTHAYDDPFIIYVKYNESIDSCVENMTFCGVNVSKTEPNNMTLNVSLDTTFNPLMYMNMTNSTSKDIWTYTDIACGSTTKPFYIPYFCFKAICSGCVKTFDWNASCDFIQ